MITVVCGLIGAGKSTWAKKHFEIVTECEDGSKEKQLAESAKLCEAGCDFAHVTCYPTEEEMQFFKGRDAAYVWINTSERQCAENIQKRGRKRDMENIVDVLNANSRYEMKKLRSDIHFKEIEIFETDERW